MPIVSLNSGLIVEFPPRRPRELESALFFCRHAFLVGYEPEQKSFESPYTSILRWFEDRTYGRQRGDESTIHPTFSSWLRNINALSTLINWLCDLARTAPRDTQPQLHRQAAVLRAGFKRQQERCLAFLRLTEEYADRFLSDISEEIQQQSSFLEALERRLDMARVRSLRAVWHFDVSIRMSPVLSQPLPQEIKLFSEMDIILNEIRRCYIEMDKFWVEE
ncbi:hypothetical protein BC826DRAFT_1189244, partial [Russula brevipes]